MGVKLRKRLRLNKNVYASETLNSRGCMGYREMVLFFKVCWKSFRNFLLRLKYFGQSTLDGVIFFKKKFLTCGVHLKIYLKSFLKIKLLYQSFCSKTIPNFCTSAIFSAVHFNGFKLKRTSKVKFQASFSNRKTFSCNKFSINCSQFSTRFTTVLHSLTTNWFPIS